MAAVTDEQVETVRALVASIPAGRVSTYGDHRRRGRAFQPPDRRLDHAHGFVGSSVASGHQGLRPARSALDYAAIGAVARRRGAGQRWPGQAVRGPPRVLSAPTACQSTSRTSAAVRARPGNAAAVDRGCSACTARRNINARNSICGHSGSGLQRSISPSSASPHDSASTTTTPAAHDAGRQYGVMSVMPGAAVPAKSTVP